MAIEQCGFFNVPHGPILNNGHLRGPVTLKPFTDRLAVELLLTGFKKLGLSRPGIDPRSPANDTSVSKEVKQFSILEQYSN